MKILLIGILLFSTLIMGAAISKWLEKPMKHIRKGLWYGMFPMYILVLIFICLSLMVSVDEIFLIAGRNVSILFYLFTCLLFGISIRVTKENVADY